MTKLVFNQLFTPTKLASELAAGAPGATLNQWSGVLPLNFTILCDDSQVVQVNSIVAAHAPSAATNQLQSAIVGLRSYYAGTSTPTQDQINKAILLVMKALFQELN